MQHEDNAQNFVRIERFQQKFDISRQTAGGYVRRLTIVAHDNSLHSFAVQLPAPRHCRREERIVQFFRLLNW